MQVTASPEERTRVGKNLKTSKQLKVFTKKLPPTLPPVGTKTCPAVEGGARPQVTHPPLMALKSNPTDLFLAYPRDDTLSAAKTQSSTAGALSLAPTSSPAQDRPTPNALSYPGTVGAPSLEHTSSPAQVIHRGRSRGL